jgi:hypothetical protein
MVTTIAMKQLANGALPAAKGTLYTSPAVTQTLVKSIIVTNIGASPQTFNLYVDGSGTSRNIIPLNMALAAGYCMVFDDVLTLEAADKIEGDSTYASNMDYLISGVTEA